MHTAAMVAHTYRQTEVQSRSPLELVTLLYDGATQALAQARSAIVDRNGDAKREAIAQALEVVCELQNVLNVEDGGEIAASLDALYSFVNGRLIDANLQDDVNAIDEAARVLAPLREAWAQLARSTAAGEAL
ncbi:MAG: flagellar export chaperone FliS [Vicinamibacterales bacterium]